MREKFEDRRLTGVVNVVCKFDDGSVRVWNADKLTVIKQILHIVKEYTQQGYILTLRQLHYQFVSRNWIVNHDTAYKKLGSILDDCKYAGLVDWDAIEDRGRVPYIPYSVDSVKEALEDAHKYFRRNRQEGQANVVELWTEKDALSGILRRSTEKYHIHLVVNKGYSSSTALHNAYERAVDAMLSGKKFTVLYFGDHDPSGLDMVRDITDRLLFFLSAGDRLNKRDSEFDKLMDDWYDDNGYNIHDFVDKYDAEELYKLSSETITDNKKVKLYDLYKQLRTKFYLETTEVFTVKHIGLTMAQIKELRLPENPAKITDTRADSYIKKFGRRSWEVDALEPSILTEIVETNIAEEIDIDMYKEMLLKEEADKAQLEKLINSVKKKNK